MRKQHPHQFDDRKKNSPENTSRMAKVLTIILVLLLGLENASCLVEGASSNQHLHVISTKKNGGHFNVFTFEDLINQSPTSATTSKTRTESGSIVKRVESALRSTFLPSGFPNRTPEGYLRFSVWSWIQDLSTQLRSVLATQRVLEGVGVGREGATALSALMNFLVRDGCGMAATLFFTSAASSRFRTDVKRWRLFADLMVDIGITLEVAAVMVPRNIFLPMISIGNMCKAICGVAAGACGGSINLHWAKGSDISDINAKFGAQHTVTGAMGLVFAALFAKSVSNINQVHLWILYSFLTILHIFANIRCMRLIAFDSFNNARMHLVLVEFFKWWDQSHGIKLEEPEQLGAPPILSTPAEIAKKEPLFFLPTRKVGRAYRSVIPIYFGDSFNNFSKFSQKSRVELKELMQTAEGYIISSGWTLDGRVPCVVITLMSNASPLKEAKGYFHAQLLAREIEKHFDRNDTEILTINARAEVEKKAQKEVDAAWEAFQRSCRSSGWNLAKTELRTLGYEADWSL